jgi:hypothetical protein
MSDNPSDILYFSLTEDMWPGVFLLGMVWYGPSQHIVGGGVNGTSGVYEANLQYSYNDILIYG